MADPTVSNTTGYTPPAEPSPTPLTPYDFYILDSQASQEPQPSAQESFRQQEINQQPVPQEQAQSNFRQSEITDQATYDSPPTPQESFRASEIQAQNNAEQIQQPPPQESFRKSEYDAQSAAAKQSQSMYEASGDWRVRLSLAKGSNYLYNLSKNGYDAGILAPLMATQGIIFPYTPSINVTYSANYDPVDVVHSNYKFYQYKNSSVDSISISCDFTAQDANEASYLLAVIHFLKSVTKMFYGKDSNPKAGVPPPLCFLTGLGTFQFDNHPLLISQFNYNLPQDVDYIRTGDPSKIAGSNISAYSIKDNSNSVSCLRASKNGLTPGATSVPQSFGLGAIKPTYVPTRMQIQITALPVITRDDISNNFSLREYGMGMLSRGSKRDGGGIW